MEIKDDVGYEFFVYPVITVFICNIILYIYCQTCAKKDNSWIDAMWGLSFVFPNILILILRGYNDIYIRMVLITTLVSIWGLRLSIYIWIRHKSEDYRYKQMRSGWEEKSMLFYYLAAFFFVFIGQGIFSLIINSSALFVNIYTIDNELLWTDYVGTIIWIIGFLIEVISDYQLSSHLKNPKLNSGKFIKTGLWRYSRHPNYFGESILWWGIFIIACSLDFGWITIFSCIFITLLIRFVSGVPFPEKKYKDNKEWKEYCKETNIFFPWFVKKSEII